LPPSIALIVRCFNEEAHIGRLLTGVRHQSVQPDELIVVDSGSTDATLAIASTFDATIVSLRPEDFSFGHALNVGIQAATTDIAVMASAHVYPLYDTWLERLADPFEDPQIGLAYGRQQAPIHSRFSEQQLLRRWFPETSVRRQREPFCNNANAAIRRSLWEDLPYDEGLTGLEDLDWAKKALARGYLLSYVAEAPIVHVHDESFQQILNRYRREAIAHKQIFREQRMGAITAARLGLMNIIGDIRAAQRQGVLREHLVDIPVFRTAQFYGTYRGFAQQGPVPEMLRRRFYYPPEASHLEDRADGPGQLIDYDAPLSHR
jgi:glycosyltransferase involved in cell wall biosynthesis